MIKINQAMTKKKIINSGRKNKIIIILKSAKKIKKNKIVNENLTLITLLIIQISSAVKRLGDYTRQNNKRPIMTARINPKNN